MQVDDDDVQLVGEAPSPARQDAVVQLASLLEIEFATAQQASRYLPDLEPKIQNQKAFLLGGASQTSPISRPKVSFKSACVLPKQVVGCRDSLFLERPEAT